MTTAVFCSRKSGSLAQLKEAALSDFGRERGDVEARILNLGRVFDALNALEHTLSDKCAGVGAHPVSFRFVKESVERLINAIRYMVGEQFAHWPLDPEPESVPDAPTPAAESAPSEAAPQSASQATATSQAPAAGMTMSAGGAIATRAQALSELQRIANYFQQAEPHSQFICSSSARFVGAVWNSLNY